MEEVKKRVEAYDQPVTYTGLKDFIDQIDIDDIDYKPHLREPEVEGDYGRNIFTLDPFECVLIYWPPGSASAVHHHDGLFGYVWVLEGMIDNIFYRETEGQLEEYAVDRYTRNGLIPEPDGVIHKIANTSDKEPAVSLHFYYPALVTLEDMRIFNLELGKVGVLSAEALTASWQEIPGHFKSVTDKVFDYVSFEKLNEHKSHRIANVIPKPDPEVIKAMNSDYFCEQAEQYDFADFNLPNRKQYTQAIDELVADHVKQQTNVGRVMDIACGTGRRALNIRELSGLDYAITGVDISEKMCAIAAERGIETHHDDWLEHDHDHDESFEAITFLYAFGHIPSREERLHTLHKINRHLSDGGMLYVDLFNRDNETEWGPQAVKAYEEKNLQECGYEKGDVFYQKRGCEEVAFIHYFDLEEARLMLAEAGFELIEHLVIGYSVRSGEVLDNPKEGNYFVVAKKSN